MQSAPSGRRYALVPGTATPSPELAQRLLERTIDKPLEFSLFDQKLESPAGENAALAFNRKAPATDHEVGGGSFSWTCAETQRHQNHRTWNSGSKDLGERALELSDHERPGRRNSLRACKAHRASPDDLRDKKRKHATSVQEHGRRSSRDLSEDTPHMSEMDSDDGMKPAYRDVFEGRRHRSSIREVRAAVLDCVANANGGLPQPATTKALDIPRSYDGSYSTPSICGISPRDTSSLSGRPPYWGC